LIDLKKNCLILKDQLKIQEAEYEQKCQSLSFELNEFKENILSDNERFCEYEAKLKELESEKEILKEERNTILTNLNNEQEKNSNLLEEFNQLKDGDYKNLQEKLEQSRIEVENLNQNNEKLRSDFEVILGNMLNSSFNILKTFRF
jgi:chromosome segregation ATPase